MQNTEKISALLFDLGGVVIDIDFDRVFLALENISELSFAEIKNSFSMDDAYRCHERGEMSAALYFEYLRKRFQLTANDAEICKAWNSVFLGEIPETLKIINRVKSKISCFAFSNTNSTHQQAWTKNYPRVVLAFEKIFVSCELGLRKPERGAFDSVCKNIGVDASEILFFDDNLENIDGALAAGLPAIEVTSPEDVSAALKTIGLV